MSQSTPAVRADLASTGKIRAGINYGNFILATKDAATGESRGVAVDVLHEVGRRLGVPVEIVAYDSVGAMVDAATTGAWDMAFLGSEPARERVISFTAAYLEIEATYLVKDGSPLRNAAEVDRDGVTVSAPSRANYELFLTRTLKHAKLVSAANGAAAFDLLVTGKVDALAGLTQGLIDLAAKLPGSRLLEGRFMGVQQSIGVPKGRDAGLSYLKSVVEDAKASGLVASAIEKTGARGVSVAPRAPAA
ncbi:MAG: transporter substrate-binding domain-containing protein [Gammaproteobacteria bacterium]